MARTAWRFEDPYTSDTYEFAVNPKTPMPWQDNRDIVHQDVEPDGTTVLVEGHNSTPDDIQLSGFTLTAEQLADLDEWMAKPGMLHLYDHLGGAVRVMVSSFVPTRPRKTSRHGFHEWTATLIWYGNL